MPISKERKIFIKNFKRLREERGLSINEIHKSTQISRRYIGQIERGEANLTIDIASKLAKFFKVSLIEMLKK